MTRESAGLMGSRESDITELRAANFPERGYWSVAAVPATSAAMGETAVQQNIRSHRISRERPKKQTEGVIGRKLLEIVVYEKNCRIGGKLLVADLVDTTEIGDWKMPDFRAACTYVVCQGWLIVEGDTLTLTTAGLAAA
jgi:hypothetical protein